MLSFETLTYCPFDKNLILQELLNVEETKWINIYHQQIINKYERKLSNDQKSWLKNVCSPI